MKTLEDLKKLYATIIENVANRRHNVGSSYNEQSEDGWNYISEGAENYYCYEKDGWSIEVCYDVYGEWAEEKGDYWSPGYCDLVKAWGEVTEIIATFYDEETDEETQFSDSDLEELWKALDEALVDVAA